ncbi:MAG: NAD(P)-dependent glycerol-3-phosphate dehydrogenase [Rhodobacteraceae bacterium]|nr:NAD(P)-dependent glycerol-3-phosphate dehydrogenase [Paracoccaceae bacterium]
MSSITIAGAGAFGTALAIALAREGRTTRLWSRDADAASAMQDARQNASRLPGAGFPRDLLISADADDLAAETVLIAVPTQSLRGFLAAHGDHLQGSTCVLCCKGIESGTGLLPSQILASVLPDVRGAVLTGPGFASEIARGLPTALTLAMDGAGDPALQALLSTATLRLYLSNDPTGAQLGGALKNVIAIACGISIGAGLGESARAALMTRGYAEMMRLATDMGASAATLAGLSGFGDLALTCTSLQSRNYALGHRLGQGGAIGDGTLEGVATARASLTLAEPRGVEMPVAGIVAAVLEKSLTINEAVAALLSRPLKAE